MFYTIGMLKLQVPEVEVEVIFSQVLTLLLLGSVCVRASLHS